MFPGLPEQSDTAPSFQGVEADRYQVNDDDNPCLCCLHPCHQPNKQLLLAIEDKAQHNQTVNGVKGHAVVHFREDKGWKKTWRQKISRYTPNFPVSKALICKRTKNTPSLFYLC
ncbi:MAG: hypothetical protein KZQ83_16660 [gamma proteobacterium symbiont of Taylorina sp.]|nr:hypothetical protein [gamma proteobacterium symbiont of Taylorina sp.]